jgi:hypothetical protein
LSLSSEASDNNPSKIGFRPYVDTTHMVLGNRVGFAQLVKVYGTPREGEQRSSPGGGPITSKIKDLKYEQLLLALTKAIKLPF